MPLPFCKLLLNFLPGAAHFTNFDCTLIVITILIIVISTIITIVNIIIILHLSIISSKALPGASPPQSLLNFVASSHFSTVQMTSTVCIGKPSTEEKKQCLLSYIAVGEYWVSCSSLTHRQFIHFLSISIQSKAKTEWRS